jgi:hypothetical protein
MTEFPFFTECDSTTPWMQWTPSSLLGMIVMGWLSMDSPKQSLIDRISVEDLSRSAMRFMFNHFLTLHVTDADRAQHIADHAKRLSSSEKAALDVELQAVPDDLPSWELRDLETGAPSEYSFKPTKLVLVEGTSTEESTWDAISKAVMDFNSRVGAGNKTDEYVYLAFADNGAAASYVDGCVVFRSGTGDTRVIPMRLAVARDASLAGASEWVDGLRAKLASGADVAAFCVVRPA